MGDQKKYLSNLIIVITYFSIFINSAKGQEAHDEIHYFDSSALFECKVKLPIIYDPERAYPLVIGLHGGGNSLDEFIDIWKYFENPEFIFAVPQAPYKWLMEEKIGYDWSAWPTGDIAVMARALDLTSKYIADLVESLRERYNTQDVYLLGFSQGSIITVTAGINNHHLFKGLIILSGPPLYEPTWSPFVDWFDLEWPTEESARSAKDLRVFIAHGNSDQLVDINLAYKSRDIFEKFGYNVTFFEHKDGHVISPDAIKQIKIWLKSDL
jgi:phospholipase/carboxylesterase